MTRKYDQKDFIKAFWSKVRKTTSCWLWMGARNTVPGEEYGFVAVNRRTQRAHRVSYAMKHGPIPNGASILHTCDNPPCVRWSHLFEGTAKINAIDRNKKGRITYQRGNKHWTRRNPGAVARGKRSGRYTHPERTARGERHGMAILTLEAVNRIRRMYLTGKYSYSHLASMFGVAYGTIGALMAGRTWPFATEGEKAAVAMVRRDRTVGRMHVRTGQAHE